MHPALMHCYEALIGAAHAAGKTVGFCGQAVDEDPVFAATLAELETLPGVGPKTAQLIVDGRPYATVDDLLRVKGIGPATLTKIKPLATAQ